MQKIFYYPSYVQFARFGATGRLVAATIVVFVMTWFLHGYQWFWLRGSFLLTVPDVVFWTILALLVLANTLWELKRGRKRALTQQSLTTRELVSRSFRIAGTFSLLIFLWSLWTSTTIPAWLELWSMALNLQGIAILALVFLGIMAVAGLMVWLTGDTGQGATAKSKRSRSFFQTAALNGVSIALLLIIATPAVYNRLGGQVASVMSDVSSNRLNDRDAELLVRGYYEDLIGVNRFNTELWDLYSKRPTDWPRIQDTGAARMTGDYLALELVPNQRIQFHGATFSTNSWGMRDQEYALTPSPGTYRVVLLGPSFVMGSGAADNAVFEWLLEERLNAEAAGGPYERYEILNMGVAGYSALQEHYVLETQALDYQPAAIFYIAHQLEDKIIARTLATFIAGGVEIPYPHLLEIAEAAGVRPGMTQAEVELLLEPYSREILVWTYDQMAALAQEHNAEFVWIFIPALETAYEQEEVTSLAQLATDAGFTVVDISDVYDNHDEAEIVVAEWDKHPNARGHRLIAERLYQALQDVQWIIPPGARSEEAVP